MLNPISAAGLIVSTTFTVVPLSVPEMFAVVDASTPTVVIVNVAELDPAGTVTDVGVVALALSDARATVMPPVPAAPLKVTVPIVETPPRTEESERLIPVSVAALIVNGAELVLDPCVAVIFAVTVLETPSVATVKVFDFDPAGTVTVAGTVAFALSDEIETTKPPDGAGPFNVTVPVELFPPATVVGARVKVVSDGGRIVRPLWTVTVP